jgi:hypothetical protein
MLGEDEDAAPRRPTPQNLPADTRREFDRVIKDLCQRVVDEADRLAAARDEGAGLEPITPADIRRAARYLEGMPGPVRLSLNERAFQGASYLAAIVAGYFVNNIDKAWGAVGFAIVTGIGIVTYVFGLQERRSGRR